VRPAAGAPASITGNRCPGRGLASRRDKGFAVALSYAIIVAASDHFFARRMLIVATSSKTVRLITIVPRTRSHRRPERKAAWRCNPIHFAFFPAAKDLFHRVAQAVLPPLDDVVLAEYKSLRNRTHMPHLTLMLPLLHRRSGFGSTVTGIDICCRLFLALPARTPIYLREIVANMVTTTDTSIISISAAKVDLSVSRGQSDLDLRRGNRHREL
jgi:hypothetical protein